MDTAQELQHVWWFGGVEWNHRVVREDNHIDVPVATKCAECTQRITERDRGVVAPCSPHEWGVWTLRKGGFIHKVCSYHSTCWLSIVEAGRVEGTRVEQRVNASVEPVASVEGEAILIPAEHLLDPDDPVNDETHSPGGW